MNAMRVICFEDDQVERLAPITHARPAYAIRCGSFRLIDWLCSLTQPSSEGQNGQIELSGVVREHLQTLQQQDYGIDAPESLTRDSAASGGVLLVNARLVPSTANFQRLQQMSAERARQLLWDAKSETLMAGWWPREECERLRQHGDFTWQMLRAEAESSVAQASRSPADQASIVATNHSPDASLTAFDWAHDVVAEHLRIVGDSVLWRTEHGDYTQREDGVFVGEGVEADLGTVFDTTAGPIVLEDGVQVGPFTLLKGPLHVGRGTRIVEHASIKDGSALAHTVKIGGEVEASIIEPYTNKQHYGFLGHSYLGSWINLGAGTSNSDLKNTYGKINVTYGAERVASGMQFLGCIMGDYSKTAINTGIFTGKTIGVCSMLYGFVTTNVPSFTNYARLFGQTSLLPPEVVVQTQARMFARRRVPQRPCDIQLIESMYRRTEAERHVMQSGGF